MYKVGDYIIYGNHGVSRVDAVGKLDTIGENNDRIYYTLSPVYQDGKIYTPIDTSVFMRPVITHVELSGLLKRYPSIPEKGFDENNFKLLEGHYRKTIQTHECSDLMQLIKTINKKKRIAESQNKRLGSVDERFIRIAEDLLYGEFAIVLDIPKESVKEYINKKIDELHINKES